MNGDGFIVLETEEQVERLEDLKRRVYAEMVRRGMRSPDLNEE